MKLGFVGAGNMTNAILRGIVEKAAVSPHDIFVYNRHAEKADLCKERYGVNSSCSLDDLIEQSDCIVLAVKPKEFPSLLPQIAKKNKALFIISIAAGRTIEEISSYFADAAAIVRVMPNINAKVGASMSAYCKNNLVTAEQEEFVKHVFSSCGKIIYADEEQFPIFSAVAGCSPAYAYLYIDSLARAAVKHGMNKKKALEIAAQTVLGSAKLILESEEHPWELVDQVCSPGGTTIEGVLSLQESGFETSVAKAVDASFNKDKRM